MSKTLNQFLEVYRPKSADEQKFVDKHVTVKNKDRNGNGDDVFQAKNVKVGDRKKENHGYEVGEDEKVYEGLSESTYEFDVSGEHGNAAVDKLVKHANSNGIKAKVHTYDGPGGGNPVIHLSHKDPKVVHAYAKKHIDPDVDLSDHKINEALIGNQHRLDVNKNGKLDPEDFKRLRNRKKKVAEEAEELEELSKDTVRNYFNKGGEQGKKITDKMKMSGGDWSSDGSDTKTLRKRAAGRAMAYKRRTGEIKMSEDSEQLEENYRKLSNRDLHDKYRQAVNTLRGMTGTPPEDREGSDFNAAWKMHSKTADTHGAEITRRRALPADHPNHIEDQSKFFKKRVKEEVDQIDELSTSTMRSYRTKAHDDAISAYGGDRQSGVSDRDRFRKRSAGLRTGAKKILGRGENLTSEEAVAMRAAKKYGSIDISESEYDASDVLAYLASNLSESNIDLMLSVFEQLSEENQISFLEACETPDGLDAMLDFSITNRNI